MDTQIIELSSRCDFEQAAILAFVEVETGGKGFDVTTGKIIIQFEPAWFKKNEPYAPSGKWSLNKVDIQSREWEAFNNAFNINHNSAMLSTSIGLGQIMGFHWKRLGFSSVGAMWDDAKKGIPQQFFQLVKFIQTDDRLIIAMKNHDWDALAKYYNGSGYKELAKKIGREPYDISLRKSYEKHLKLLAK